MNRVSKISAALLLIFGVIFGVFAIYSSQTNLNKSQNIHVANEKTLQARDEIQVVVASRDLPAGQNLRQEDLVIVKRAQTSPETFLNPHLLIGRTTAVAVVSQAPVLKSHLIEGISSFLKEGERAVAIKVDEASAVGHKLKPGDWVDVFVVLRQDGQEVNATQSRMLLPRKRVIAYGAKTQSDAQDGDAKNNDPQNATARTAVLAVEVQEVNRLLLAEQQGQVQLALRSPLDHNEPSADMLKKIPGLNLSPESSQSVSFETHSLDSSLVALKMSELGSDRVATPVFNKSMHEAPRKLRKGSSSTEVAVEVLRGGRKEIIHY